ncbi:acetyl-CoA C-acetyltransferase [Cryobacterium mesophilum]|uniref:Probable acetyl-CoA acetyltransferase n=1 Tax=Terrimesophilobacter mesophilus TaxID=433647 RepID=A0A4R8VHJ7_9MICO|nr:acetyl-CoA C-acetyltransferase [Terrimesophilobacter mesophilus]MBB5634017.1 acetyl-CoA C-acetyltransferase [Terrimesophilobacter mesophilus]TFB81367.1 acetyl-CoA C-acetyltransferase [Terrimesophilobacter mesophilus]
MNQRDVVILAGARTPLGRLNGALSSLTAVELGAAALRAAIERSGVDVADIDAVIFGQVLQAGLGQGPARQTSIAAGIGWDVPAVTINKLCLSGLTAVIDAARIIRTGEAEVVAVGGQESMSNAPHLLMGSRKGWQYGSIEALDHMAYDGLTDAFDHDSMGLSTERHNLPLGISRSDQDKVAAASHQRAAAAAELLAEEIVPVTIHGRKGDTVVAADEGIRADSTLESLSTLKPAFNPEGTITAGNSSQISDGAAALIVASRDYAEAHGLEWLALVGAAGQVAGPDNSLHAQPARAISAALERGGWETGDLDFVEINEAFAAVSVHSSRALGLSNDIVNVHGGAIALGHPIGASGARLALHAAYELKRRGTGRAAVSLCGGGGQGEALLLSRP